MKLSILHITHDDKFIDHFIHDFDSLDGIDNKYIVYTEHGINNLKSVKSKKVLFAEKGSETLRQLIGDIQSYSAIFIHYLTPYLAEEILSHKKLPPLFLMFWGGDIFSLPEFKFSSLGPKSTELMAQFTEKVTFHWAWKPKNLLLEYKRYKGSQHSDKTIRKALQRFDFFCHYIPADYTKIKAKINLKCAYLDFNYGSIQSILAGRFDAPYTLDSPNILVGNSAAITNNHTELLTLLSEANIAERKIFAPLSYDFSPSESYADYVSNYGELLFKDQFSPMREFIERSVYNEIFDSVGFVFMNHYRSQGAGSVITALYLGKKVFLSEENTLYGLLKSWGIFVFSIQKELHIENDQLWIPLSLKQRDINRKILEDNFEEAHVRKKYQLLINVIISKV